MGAVAAGERAVGFLWRSKKKAFFGARRSERDGAWLFSGRSSLTRCVLLIPARPWPSWCGWLQVPAGTRFEDAIDSGHLLQHASAVLLAGMGGRASPAPLGDDVRFLRHAANSSFWESRSVFADVEAFLTACVGMGVGTADVCTAADIIEHTDPRRAATCVLAMYQKALQKGVRNLPQFAGERGGMATTRVRALRDRLWAPQRVERTFGSAGGRARAKVGFLALLAAAAGLLALAQRKASRRRTIVVRRGDTLWSLAERYLGSSKRWRELLERNPELADHPDILFPQDAVHVR